MASGQCSPVTRYLRRITAAHADHLSDSTLLDRFADRHDEDAFAILVHRHGRLVLGACQRIVHDWHGAEDCFQAVFLVLASKAATVERTESLGPWLHAVATRVALKARSQAARRSQIEQDAASSRARAEVTDHIGQDLRPILDAAINRLADKYRIPFVLCHLQGRTVSEIANQFGEPRGTVAARLARAREQLRKVLTRRGVALSAASLGLILGGEALASPVPPALAAGTLQAARLMAAGRAAAASLVSQQSAALMEGVLRSMFISKLKTCLGVLALVAVGTALLGYRAMATELPDQPKTTITRVPNEAGQNTIKMQQADPFYLVPSELVEIDSKGQETVIATPRIAAMKDQQASIEFVKPGTKDGAQAKPETITCTIKVHPLEAGKCRFELAVAKSMESEPSLDEHKVISSLVRMTKTLKYGEKLELDIPSLVASGPVARLRFLGIEEKR